MRDLLGSKHMLSLSSHASAYHARGEIVILLSQKNSYSAANPTPTHTSKYFLACLNTYFIKEEENYVNATTRELA